MSKRGGILVNKWFWIWRIGFVRTGAAGFFCFGAGMANMTTDKRLYIILL
jgi:hypothetical protein